MEETLKDERSILPRIGVLLTMSKYTITIDVESSMDVDQLSKKIQRLDRIETFMIKYHKVQKVDKFDSNPYYDIVSDHVNEVP